jgi:hypothetical protein
MHCTCVCVTHSRGYCWYIPCCNVVTCMDLTPCGYKLHQASESINDITQVILTPFGHITSVYVNRDITCLVVIHKPHEHNDEEVTGVDVAQMKQLILFFSLMGTRRCSSTPACLLHSSLTSFLVNTELPCAMQELLSLHLVLLAGYCSRGSACLLHDWLLFGLHLSTYTSPCDVVFSLSAG